MSRRALHNLRSVLNPVTINVNLPPEACLEILSTASRPSSERLHLREAFVEGRRYHIESTSDGFRMATTSKTLFNRKRRTDPLCLMTARLSASGNHQTSVSIQTQTRLAAYVYSLWVPLGMATVLWPVPWPRILIVGVLGGIFGLAWAALRYGAALEATEMLYFIQKAFEDVPKFSLGLLPASADTIVGGHDFEVLWEQFVRARRELT